MTFDWRTYRPRKTRNGFETAKLYLNTGVLIIAVAFTFLITLLVAGCSELPMQILHRQMGL